jgi:hypothetical protein
MPRLARRPSRALGYQPRHRSPRWDKLDQRILADLPPIAVRPPDDQEFFDDLEFSGELGFSDDLEFSDDPEYSDDPEFADDPEYSADGSSLSGDCEDADFVGELTRGQMRRILEGSAINDDLVTAVPELACFVAHSSHTSATLASAWADFQQATRDAYGLHIGRRAWWEFFRPQELGSRPQAQAIEVKLSLADDAWCLITNGEP